ncbi:MAG TPA: cytochrome c oxidase subunit II [Thermohalobaculum sp.]|nr:cytochrome c oxidase subunit II [Thermohalobaculum sp.]
MRIANLCAWAMAGIMMLSGRFAGAAEAVAGRPIPKGTGFQRAVTEVARDIFWLDDLLLVVVAVISIFVTILLLIVIVKFNRKANPTPATFTHNAVLEVAWTVIPVIILVVIAIPSLRLLFLQLEVPEPDLTIKATGNQWYWSYEYPDANISFDAVMLQKDELEANGYTADDWLFATDTRVVVPVNAVVHMVVTGSDVIHAWAIPSFGSKIDAVPGRLNETWFKAEETGVFYGQCSELCGMNHTYMPIVVEVMEQPAYDAWVQTQQALNDTAPTEQPTKLAVTE